MVQIARNVTGEVDGLGLSEPPQQPKQHQSDSDEADDLHTAGKPDFVLRRILRQPGLPNLFVELGLFIGLRHSVFINYHWCSLRHDCD